MVRFELPRKLFVPGSLTRFSRLRNDRLRCKIGVAAVFLIPDKNVRIHVFIKLSEADPLEDFASLLKVLVPDE